MENGIRVKNDAQDDDRLPEWCDVYAGLSEMEIEKIEQSISRRLDLTRTSHSSTQPSD